jgi:alanine racemase
MYGLHPCPEPDEIAAASRLRPTLSIKAQAARIADVEAGVSVGYGGTWVAPRRSRIATLPIGYADGWLRGAGPRTHVLVRGRQAPVVGRISSDSMTVDITDAPGVDERDVFVLLGVDSGKTITAEDVAAARDTISWEVLQTLSRRLPRLYLIKGLPVALRRMDHERLIVVPDLHSRLERAAADELVPSE